MEPMAWIALGSLTFLVVSTVVGAAVGCVVWIGAKFDAHEKCDQKRHTDNLERFGDIDLKLATLIGNGSRPRRQVATRSLG